jgi:hypothetical protein
MTCPKAEVLTIHASLTGQVTPAGEDLLEGWTRPKVEAHLMSCADCRAVVESWKHSLKRWGAVDILDTEAWGDDYFEQLQGEVEEGLWNEVQEVTAPVIDLAQARSARNRTLALVASVAAVLLVGLLMFQQSADQASETPELAGQQSDGAEDEDLEARGREIGRALLASLSAEDLDDPPEYMGPAWGRRALLEAEDTELDYFFSNNTRDALDALDRLGADALIKRL